MKRIKEQKNKHALKRILCFVMAFILNVSGITVFVQKSEAAESENITGDVTQKTVGDSNNVIFISDTLPSNGDGSGKDASNPLVPVTGKAEVDANTALYQAIMKLKELGGGTIVFCGPVRLDNTNCERFTSTSSYYDFMIGTNSTAYNNCWPNIKINYTSVWNGVDYRKAENGGAKLVLGGKSSITFPTATNITNLTIDSEDNYEHYICGGRNPLTFGEGTYFEPYDNRTTANGLPIIVGAYRNQQSIGDNSKAMSITVDMGNSNKIGHIYGMYGGGGSTKYHGGGVTINIKSGHVIGKIVGDSAAYVGTKSPITINIEGGIIGRGDTVGGQIIGTNIGFDSSVSKKSVAINISGGDFTNCTSIKGYASSVAVANRPTAIVNAEAASMSQETKLSAIVDTSTATYIKPTGSVIFISDNVEGSNGSGNNAANPLIPTTGNAEVDANTALYQAIMKLKEEGGGTIVFCGPVRLDNTNCEQGNGAYDFMIGTNSTAYNNCWPNINIKYTSVYGGVDYRKAENGSAKLVLGGNASITFPTATKITNLTIDSEDTYLHYVCAGRNPITFGEGTYFEPYDNRTTANGLPIIVGAYRNQQSVGDNSKAMSITVDIGDNNKIGHIYGMYGGGASTKYHGGGATINIKSGHVIGNITGDSAAHVATKSPITINIEGGIIGRGDTIGGQIIGTNIGFDSSAANKTVAINITGGDFIDCKGIKGHASTLVATAPSSVVVNASSVSQESACFIKNRANSTVTTLNLPSDYVDYTIKHADGFNDYAAADWDSASGNFGLETSKLLIKESASESYLYGTAQKDGYIESTFEITGSTYLGNNPTTSVYPFSLLYRNQSATNKTAVEARVKVSYDSANNVIAYLECLAYTDGTNSVVSSTLIDGFEYGKQYILRLTGMGNYYEIALNGAVYYKRTVAKDHVLTTATDNRFYISNAANSGSVKVDRLVIADCDAYTIAKTQTTALPVYQSFADSNTSIERIAYLEKDTVEITVTPGANQQLKVGGLYYTKENSSTKFSVRQRISNAGENREKSNTFVFDMPASNITLTDEYYNLESEDANIGNVGVSVRGASGSTKAAIRYSSRVYKKYQYNNTNYNLTEVGTLLFKQSGSETTVDATVLKSCYDNGQYLTGSQIYGKKVTATKAQDICNEYLDYGLYLTYESGSGLLNQKYLVYTYAVYQDSSGNSVIKYAQTPVVYSYNEVYALVYGQDS